MLQVAIDAGPLHGHRTGVGQAVAGTIDALRARDDLTLLPYVTSTRTALQPGERRLPLPAAAAHRLWSRTTAGVMDRFLGRPDVVHGTNYVVPPARCASVVSVYDCWFLEHRDQSSSNVRRAGDVLRRAVANGAHVVTSSDATSEKARDLLATTNVTTIHLGPPPPPEAPSDPSPRLLALTTPFVVALGTLERRKSIPTLVRAFGLVGAEHPTVRLVLAGADGDDAQAVSVAIGRLDSPVRSRVERLGVVTDEEKSWLLANATALAYPSLDEGFGFPILEAQQAGLPVVASAVGSIPEVGGSAVLLTPPRDSHALAANLHWMVGDSAMRERMIGRGHRNLERFSWDSSAAALALLYQRLVERT